jgi:tRNA uridine 5-carboxymethylaminomethyl modification enzyme
MGKVLSKQELLELINTPYDVLIVGGGHAGVEASLAAARIGLRTIMVCGDFHHIGNMPCNPSIGGPAKGILVREIDALGGQMARSADETALQFKMLNMSKGPAVWAMRVQSDKLVYAKYMQKVCLEQENLDIYIGLVDAIKTADNCVSCAVLEDGTSIPTKRIVVTTGTYLSSCVLCGNESHPAGPDEEKTNYGLSTSLRNLGFHLLRLKTGTPPRVYTDTIDFSKLQLEPGTNLPLTFSYETNPASVRKYKNQVPCYLIWTNATTHKIIFDHMKECSMYSGLIKGVGPRYCPSIETKLVRFADKEKHQLFLEPESMEINETYLQGFSTSMPHDIQDKMVASLSGFEHAKIARYAYAIEYDAIDPLELKPTLETKKVKGLYFGGQVNGTSGYEEAAAQGLMAGINASCSLTGKKELILHRDEAYLGVLIDDLVTKGVIDPYRMLTSRAEYRLLLRHDNADQRLLQYGYEVGLVKQDRYDRYLVKMKQIKEEKARLEQIRITPKEGVNAYLALHQSQPLNEGISAMELMRRPEIMYSDIVQLANLENPVSNELGSQLDIEIKYQGYIEKAYKEAKKMLKLETVELPNDFDYDDVPNLASEAREKLKQVRPVTIAQAIRISGVNPSDISILLVYLEMRRRKNDR